MLLDTHQDRHGHIRFDRGQAADFQSEKCENSSNQQVHRNRKRRQRRICKRNEANLRQQEETEVNKDLINGFLKLTFTFL